MYRSQLQHVILEIGQRFEFAEFHIIGSAAILATLPNPPEGALTATRDVDVIPPDDDERMADRISFVLGEASDFDREYGYYAQGVTSSTPRYAPTGWKARAIPIRVDQYTGWCMDPHDLVLSKLGAGREKDLAFAKDVADLGLLRRDELLLRAADVPCSDDERRMLEARIRVLLA